MCGIFGVIDNDAVGKTLEALHFLEYRGYDSAGIAVKSQTLKVVKTVGRVAALEAKTEKGLCGDIAIGHTRWATHGTVCEKNAHPFLSQDGNFAICHNGIVENFRSLRQELQQKGIEFRSETDSEVVAHLLQLNYNGSVLDALLKTANELSGAFAVLAETAYDGSLYAIKNKSPLVVGRSEQGVYFCSDVRCVSRWAKEAAVVPDNTAVVATGDKIDFFTFDGNRIYPHFFETENQWTGCDFHGDAMEKEIFEIPERVRDAKKGYFQSGGIKLPKLLMRKLRRIYFLGCGTAYNSGLEAASVARSFLGVDLVPVIASEFVYDNYPVDDKTLAFCISQSGETADTIRAAEKVNSLGGYTYAVTNTETSSLCFVCNSVKNVYAGGEYAVASTKAYNCQLVTLILLISELAYCRRELTDTELNNLLSSLDKLPLALDSILQRCDELNQLAEKLKDCSAVFFVGRCSDYPTAMEGSLKLKEISYIHSEAYPSGELKHGTLALMEKGVTVVAISTSCDLVEKNNSTAQEIISREADVITISPYKGLGMHFDLPVTHKYLYGILSVVPLQLLAYYAAKALNRDVDKPRNLAKSVTVE